KESRAGESLIEHKYLLVNTRIPVGHLSGLYACQDTSVDSSNSSLSAASSLPTHSGCPQGQGSRGVCFESPHTALQNWSSISTRHRQDSWAHLRRFSDCMRVHRAPALMICDFRL